MLRARLRHRGFHSIRPVVEEEGSLTVIPL